jgi:hypothetical protein
VLLATQTPRPATPTPVVAAAQFPPTGGPTGTASTPVALFLVAAGATFILGAALLSKGLKE